MWGDSAYTGQAEAIRTHAPRARDFTNKNFTATTRPPARSLAKADKGINKGINRARSKVRAKVEHPFLVIKRIFGFSKVRYRGPEKNTSWLHVSCALANLYMARRRLLESPGSSVCFTLP